MRGQQDPMNVSDVPEDMAARLAAGTLIPYLGPGVLALVPGECPVPATAAALAAQITAKVTVPHKIRTRLSAAAQFIENFKHRKTIVSLMNAAFAAPVPPTVLHRYLAQLPELPLVVDTWYDDATQAALGARTSWGQVQGLSQSEHFGTWTACYDAQGAAVAPGLAPEWKTLLYKPLGAARPAHNYLVSDSDYVEVLTEIDIQTPVPLRVQQLRSGRGFLFLGCRFDDQLQRTFARQIMKRSSARHWAVLSGSPTRNEARFMQEQGIVQIDLPLAEFARRLAAQPQFA